MAKVDEAITKFFDTLLRLDQEGFPPDSLNLDDATFRAHLGLPNSCNVTIDPEKGYNSKAAGAFWISLLRFQVLDLLLSMAHGVSDTPSPKEAPPTATGPVSLLSALTNWPTFLESLKNKYAKDTKAADSSKPSTAEAVKSLLPAGAVVPEAFTPLLALTDMHAVTLATKTLKNFQAMGTALMWILECNTTNPFDIPTTMKLGDTFDWLDQEGKDRFKKLTVAALLRPLSYAINSSPVVAICNNDLSNSYGHVMSQYKTRAFIGRYRTPRLTHVEDVILTVVREVAIGKQVAEAAARHWYPGIVSMPPSRPEDCDIFKTTPIPADPAPSSPPPPPQPSVSRVQSQPKSASFSRPAALEIERSAPESFAFSLAMGICSWPNGSLDSAEHFERETFAFPIRKDGDVNMNEGEGSEDCAMVVEKQEAREACVSPIPPPQRDDDMDTENNSPAQLGTDLNNEVTEEPANDFHEGYKGPGQFSEGGQVHSLRAEQRVETRQETPQLGDEMEDEGEEDEAPLVKQHTSNLPLDDAETKRKGRDEQPPPKPVGDDTNAAGATESRGTGDVPTTHEQEPSSQKPSQPCGGPEVRDEALQLPTTKPQSAAAGIKEWPEPLFSNEDHPIYGPLSPPPAEFHSTPETPTHDDSTKGSRRSGRLIGIQSAAPIDVESASIPSSPKTSAKRKRKGRDQGSSKKSKIEEEFASSRSLDLVEEAPPKRSTVAVKLWGYRPDGFSGREFDWIGHVNTDHIERPMLEDIQRSIAAVDARCTQTGRRWRHHVDGNLPTAPPSENEFGLLDQTIEVQAFRQTNGLPTFDRAQVPAEQQFFQIAGTPHTLSPPHYDKGHTRLTVEGPGEKHWMIRQDHREGELENAYAFENWDVNETSLQSGRYEGVILPPNAGTLLMQCREHIVVGLPPSEAQSSAQSEHHDQFTVVTGGHFMAASTVIVSTCMLLHLVMKEYVLTNVEHDGSWCIFVRICAFWMDVTAGRPIDSRELAPYLPLLSEHSAAGWMDIISLASVITLCNPFDRRQYGPGIPLPERRQRQEVCRMYKQWRAWLSETFEASIDGNVIAWEQDIFSASLVHLAVVLIQYHERARYREEEGPDILLRVDNLRLAEAVKATLDAYDQGLGQKLQNELDGDECQNHSFFLFKGQEITIQRR
ncbi:hypothetical protein C8R46DRAFT_1034891 [Mycena filopes]|nr:hypothetical protein C8R46DRAFT_1034891 [Mycena filopes]